MKRLIAAIVAAVTAACATAADDSDADPQTYLELYPTDSTRDQINYWRTRLYRAQSGSERYRIEAILRDLNRQKEAEDEAAARAAVREADLVAKINACLLRCPRPPPRP
jgi:fructose-bisphosphate aldolase class 1